MPDKGSYRAYEGREEGVGANNMACCTESPGLRSLTRKSLIQCRLAAQRAATRRRATRAGPPGVEKMLEALLRPAPGKNLDPALAGALAQAAAALARLDQALAGHPLLPAFLHRARLDAVRRQAAVDGQVIDPWHLAAVLEGFRLRMDGALRIIDRGAILAAARHALDLHQWLVAPDFDQEGAVQQGECPVIGGLCSIGQQPVVVGMSPKPLAKS